MVGLGNLEAVQRNYTKRFLVLRLKRIPNDWKHLFNLESLELRRLKADLILTYKIIFGLVDLHAVSRREIL